LSSPGIGVAAPEPGESSPDASATAFISEVIERRRFGTEEWGEQRLRRTPKARNKLLTSVRRELRCGTEQPVLELLCGAHGG
jgi:hypothetical protein